jgi:hypothetical protein
MVDSPCAWRSARKFSGWMRCPQVLPIGPLLPRENLPGRLPPSPPMALDSLWLIFHSSSRNADFYAAFAEARASAGIAWAPHKPAARCRNGVVICASAKHRLGSLKRDESLSMESQRRRYLQTREKWPSDFMYDKKSEGFPYADRRIFPRPHPLDSQPTRREFENVRAMKHDL